MKNKRQKNKKFFSYNFFPKNRRGWLKIAEAFAAVLIVSSIVLIVLSKADSQKEDISPTIRDAEISILRDVELDSTLRAEILATSGEVEWASFPSVAPGTKLKIENSAPSYLDCSAKICNPSSQCSVNSTVEENVYVESTMITATQSSFNPRVLKLFCLKK